MSDVTTSPPVRSRWLALVVLCAGMLMIILDGTIVNVALPAIQDDLGFSQSDLAWVVNAYLIAFGGLLLLAGRFGDLIGRKRIFFVNVPIGVATAIFAWRLIADEPGLGLRHGADVLGAALVTGSLMLGVYTIVEARGNGWGSAQTLGQGAVALALMAFFLARQAAAQAPLLPLRLFRSRNVSGANVILMLLVAGLFGMFFLGSLYLERVLGYEAIEIGLAFLPVSLGIGLLSLFVSPRLG